MLGVGWTEGCSILTPVCSITPRVMHRLSVDLFPHRDWLILTMPPFEMPSLQSSCPLVSLCSLNTLAQLRNLLSGPLIVAMVTQEPREAEPHRIRLCSAYLLPTYPRVYTTIPTCGCEAPTPSQMLCQASTAVPAHCTHPYLSSSLESSPQTSTSIPAHPHCWLPRSIAFPGKPGFDSGSQSWVRGWSWQVHSGSA